MRNLRSEGAGYEELACSYLEKKGYKIIDRNVYLLRKEVDVIALDRETVVFVEVKTRADEGFSPAEVAITPTKKARMSRAARYFIAAHKVTDRPLRFDVVAIVLGRTGRPRIRHYQNAFVP